MSKMKLYELEQEIGVKSAEILALLKNKGIEVKSHMSVLEDRQVEDVRKTLKAPAKSEEAPKTTEKTTTSGETKAPAKTGEGTTVKKKKSIIFVSNPHNSKMPGGAQIPRKTAHSDKKAAPQGGGCCGEARTETCSDRACQGGGCEHRTAQEGRDCNHTGSSKA